MSDLPNVPPPKVSFKWEFGPASILTALGILVQAGIVIWVVSSAYTGVIKSNEILSTKIDTVDKGANDRFATIRAGLQKTHDEQIAQGNRITGVETAINFIKQSLVKP